MHHLNVLRRSSMCFARVTSCSRFSPFQPSQKIPADMSLQLRVPFLLLAFLWLVCTPAPATAVPFSDILSEVKGGYMGDFCTLILSGLNITSITGADLKPFFLNSGSYCKGDIQYLRLWI
jgi:hypothetical protein